MRPFYKNPLYLEQAVLHYEIFGIFYLLCIHQALRFIFSYFHFFPVDKIAKKKQTV